MKRRGWSKLWNRDYRLKTKKWSCMNFRKWKIKLKEEWILNPSRPTAQIWNHWDQRNIVPRSGSTKWCLSGERIRELSMIQTLMSFLREIQSLFTCLQRAPDLALTLRFLRPRASRVPKNTSSTRFRSLYSMITCTSLTSKARTSRKDKIDLQISMAQASPR